MKLPEPTADAIRAGLAPVLAELVDAYGTQRTEPASDSESSPPLIARAFEQLFHVMQRSDRDTFGQTAPGTESRSVTEVDEYALELFDHAMRRANDLDLPGVFAKIQAYTIAVARWIAALGGTSTRATPRLSLAHPAPEPGDCSHTHTSA